MWNKCLDAKGFKAMKKQDVVRIFTGSTAILAGVAQIIYYALINTSGGGKGTSSYNMDAFLIISWNLLLLPTALILWQQLKSRNPKLMLLITICGLVSLLLWSMGAYLHNITIHLEGTFILLSMVW